MNLRFLALLCFSSLLQTHLHAQQASLTSSTTTPATGEPFELSIEVNTRGARAPGILDIPGIQILSQSQSTSVSISNGQVSARTVFTYTAVAAEAGELTIDPIEIPVGRQSIKTNALKLLVKKGSGRPQPRLGPGAPVVPPGLNGQPPSNGRQAFPSKIDETAAFLKVVPTREEIYVGETVEVEIKAYFDAGIPLVNFTRELSLKGEDFITKPAKGPDAQKKRVGRRVAYQFKRERIDNRYYNVLTYRTTITAVKPGTFTLSPIDYNAVIQVPQSKRQRQRRRGIGSLFGDDFFEEAFNRRQRELRIQSKAIDVTVLPLPTEGRPDHFNGAIGRFSLDVLTDKKALKVDEALKVAATITGHGNFERITQLDRGTEDSKWKAYPPKISFNSTDELELSGEKTFEYTYIAVDANDHAPIVQFAFFDPEEKKYVSLGGNPIPVTVTGSAASALTNQDLADLADQATAPGATVLAAITGSEFHRGNKVGNWLGTGKLLGLHGSAAAVAFGLAVWQWRRRNANTLSPKQRLSLLQHERQVLLGNLPQTTEATAFDTKFLRLLALHEHCREAVIGNLLSDDEAARRTIQTLPDESEEKRHMEDYLNWSAQRRWSGASQELDSSSRERWISALKSLDEQPHS